MITFTLKHSLVDGGDCECCGAYAGDGSFVYVNDKFVWYSYFDGHTRSESSDCTLLDAVIDEYIAINIARIVAINTEEGRLQYKIAHPDSGIANSAESWASYNQDTIQFWEEDKIVIKEAAKSLPVNIKLQLAMIKLWIEEYTGDDIPIIEENINYFPRS